MSYFIGVRKVNEGIRFGLGSIRIRSDKDSSFSRVEPWKGHARAHGTTLKRAANQSAGGNLCIVHSRAWGSTLKHALVIVAEASGPCLRSSIGAHT